MLASVVASTHAPNTHLLVTGPRQDTSWPLPRFYFSVDISGVASDLPFQEVSGLDTEVQAIEYRRGDSPAFSAIKMPGLAKTGNVTLRKGIFAKDNKFFEWQKQVVMNTIRRSTVTIRLLDEGGKATMTWTLANAWPTKITGTDLKADGNEVAVESVEIAHEGLTVTNG
jgi:phage tail-like protein